jgi:hypothetical protein
MSLLWELRQSAQVAAARSVATSPNYNARELARYCEFLEERIDKLTLLCRAMWGFLQEAADLSEAELAEKVKEIDLLDGKLDGKLGKTAVQCPQCNKVMAPRHKQCIWCGAERQGESAFDEV